MHYIKIHYNFSHSNPNCASVIKLNSKIRQSPIDFIYFLYTVILHTTQKKICNILRKPNKITKKCGRRSKTTICLCSSTLLCTQIPSTDNRENMNT